MKKLVVFGVLFVLLVSVVCAGFFDDGLFGLSGRAVEEADGSETGDSGNFFEGLVDGFTGWFSWSNIAPRLSESRKITTVGVPKQSGVTVERVNSAKTKSKIPYPIPNKNCISKTCSNSLEGVYNDMIRIGGFPAFDYIYSRYNGFMTIKEKEKLFAEAFSKYKFVNTLFDKQYATNEPYLNEKMFIQSVAHMIWVEENNVVSWSIKSYTKKDVDMIIYRNEFYFTIDDQKNIYTYLTVEDKSPKPYYDNVVYEQDSNLIADGHNYGRRTIELERYKVFPLSYSLSREVDSKREVIKGFLEFIEKNFFHSRTDEPGICSGCSWDAYSKYSVGDICYMFEKCKDHDAMPVEMYFKERVSGCHQTARLASAMLRSINIPASYMPIRGHGALYIPNLEIFVHGDFIADFTVLPADLYMENLIDKSVVDKYLIDTGKMYDEYNRVESQTTDSWIYSYLITKKIDNKLYYIFDSHSSTQKSLDYVFNKALPYYEKVIPDYLPFSIVTHEASGGLNKVSQKLLIKTLDEFNAEAIQRYGSKFGIVSEDILKEKEKVSPIVAYKEPKSSFINRFFRFRG